MPDRGCAEPQGHRRNSHDWRRMSGLGCFGKPETLITMLVSVMAQYERSAGQAENRLARSFAVGCAARHLMLRLSAQYRAADGPPPFADARAYHVKGFYIHADGDRVRIRVFTRETASSPLRTG
jgi:hypothetical protein